MHCSLVPSPHPAFHCFTALEVKESWTEPGYEAKLTVRGSYVTSTKVEVYNNGKIHRLLKLLFFTYKCAGILTQDH